MTIVSLDAPSGASTAAGAERERAAKPDAVLAGVRRLALLADRAEGEEAVFAALARELMAAIGAEEVHIHTLGGGRADGQDLVSVHLNSGDGRLSYLQPRGERPPGVSWAQASGRCFLAVGPRELTASVPRLASTTPSAQSAPVCALLCPLSLAGEAVAVAVLVRREHAPYDERAIEQAAALVDQAATALALARARAEAGTDSVAGCMNHRAMRRRLSEEIARAQRTGGTLSCAMVDLDDFKLVNDRLGHHAGDRLLREAADALMGEFRAFDRVARYGGDEFVVILPGASSQSAAAAGARALERLRQVVLPDGSRGVRASMGVAEWRPRMGVDDLLQACDAALLQVKRDGKGRVAQARSPLAG